MKRLLLLLWLVPALCGLRLTAQSDATLIPFQGRLTDQTGQTVTNGVFSVVFQLYNAPVGGDILWSERHERVGVLNGMVNVFLGSISALDGIDFSTTRHLGITVDIDQNPNTPDVEMVPRQMIIPAFAAKQAFRARTLDVLDTEGMPVPGQSYGWASLFSNGNPATGTISGNRLSPSSVSSFALVPGSITSAQLATNAVQAANIASGQVTIDKLPAEVAQALVPPGAVSAFAGTNLATPPQGWLFCDGRTVSRATFTRLFAVIGTTYGPGDGITTFHLPDYRWTFLRGYGPNIVATGSGFATNNQATFLNHGFNRSGIRVRLAAGALSGLSANVDYWTVVIDSSTLAFSSTKSGALSVNPTRVAVSGINTAAVAQWEDPDMGSRQPNSPSMPAGSLIGSFQDDQFKVHNVGSLLRITTASDSSDAGRGDGYEVRYDYNYSVTVPGGNETRSQNVYVNYIIKF